VATPVAGLILAAGYSSRMGEFKPLLPLAGVSALERAINLFRSAGVADVRVVTGHRAEELTPLLQRLQVRAVANPRFDAGMFSSVAAGFASLEAEIAACFVLPADLPLVRPATVRALLQTFISEPAEVLYPCFGGERGHPPLIEGRLARRLPAWQGDGGLKSALEAEAGSSRELAVVDELILRDMDRPDDFAALQRRAQRWEIPSRAECRALLALSYAPDDPVVRHSEAVATLAVELGTMLNDAGGMLDLELLEAAGLLHDLARREPMHAWIGAERLRDLGFAAAAELVASHMDLPLPRQTTIDAAEVLYLADKLVLEDRRVPLMERFSNVRERFAETPEIAAKIAGRLETARTIETRLEQILGSALSEVIAIQ